MGIFVVLSGQERSISSEPANTELISSMRNCAPGDNRDDCLALLDLFQATGSKIPGFVPGTPLCGWTGVTCDDSTRRVTTLDVHGKRLQGTIPDSMGSLSALTALELPGNKFIGTIPDSLASLSGLKTLFLYTNAFSGTVPDSLGTLSALTRLDLSNNLLTSFPESSKLCKLATDIMASNPPKGNHRCLVKNNTLACPMPSGTCATVTGATCIAAI